MEKGKYWDSCSSGRGQVEVRSKLARFAPDNPATSGDDLAERVTLLAATHHTCWSIPLSIAPVCESSTCALDAYLCMCVALRCFTMQLATAS